MNNSALLQWFRTHRRDLPWRTPCGVPRDPWRTLVSEVMSQQTRLEVVVPRFEEWMDRFPAPRHLAETPEEGVLAAWAGLGYYSRARNLHRCAQRIHRDGWPTTHQGLLDLPGLGPYTAAAIGSLCLGLQVPMVDGNVMRVLSRFHALKKDPRSGAGAREIQERSVEWIQNGDAGEINEATMELGALVCKPKKPSCDICPVAVDCRACAWGNPEAFPPPRSRRETILVRTTVLVVTGKDGVLLRRARQGELLSGLWIPPAVGDSPFLEVQGVVLGEVRHAITHHKVVWEVRSGSWKGGVLPEGWKWHPRADLGTVVVSSLVRKAMEKASISLGSKSAHRRPG